MGRGRPAGGAPIRVLLLGKRGGLVLWLENPQLGTSVAEAGAPVEHTYCHRLKVILNDLNV